MKSSNADKSSNSDSDQVDRNQQLNMAMIQLEIDKEKELATMLENSIRDWTITCSELERHTKEVGNEESDWTIR